MSLRRRIFSNENDLTFNEYLSSKKGIEILKNLKFNNKKNRDVKIDNNNNIISYLSYNDFLTLSKSFFKNTYKNEINCNAPFSLSDAKSSYICYDKINKHIEYCNDCKKNTDINNLCACKEIKNILYPYGNYNAIENQLIFPKKINLNKWCSSCKNVKNCDCNCNKLYKNELNNNADGSSCQINYDFDDNLTNINYDFDDNLTNINYDFDDNSIKNINNDFDDNSIKNINNNFDNNSIKNINNNFDNNSIKNINNDFDNSERCDDCDCTSNYEYEYDNNNFIRTTNKNNISCNEYDDRYYIKMKNKMEKINNKLYKINVPKGNNKKYCGICNKTTKFFI